MKANKRMQGKTFIANGLIKFSRTAEGKRTVDDKPVKTNTIANKLMCKTVRGDCKNHKAAPAMAMIKVGDPVL